MLDRHIVQRGGQTVEWFLFHIRRHDQAYALKKVKLLFDSIQDLGGNLAGMTRPDTEGVLVE